MAQSRHAGDLLVTGTLTVSDGLNMPDGTIGDDEVGAAAGIAATKLEHQHQITYHQAAIDQEVVDIEVPIHIVRGATATMIDIQVACLTAPTGGDKAFTVDLQVADEDTPTPASVLSGTISYSATQEDCEVEEGTVDTEELVVGDILVLVVATSGTTGTQGSGLAITVTIREDAE